MRIEVKSQNEGVILHPDGKVIGDGASQFKTAMNNWLDSGVSWLIVDLAEVPLMDSSALGGVIATHLKLEDKNGKLVLASAQKGILDVLAITKLDSVFTVCDDLQAALDIVNS